MRPAQRLLLQGLSASLTVALPTLSACDPPRPLKPAPVTVLQPTVAPAQQLPTIASSTPLAASSQPPAPPLNLGQFRDCGWSIPTEPYYRAAPYVFFSNDGRSAVVAARKPQLLKGLDTSNPRDLSGGRLGSAVFAPDGKHLATLEDGGNVLLQAVDTAKVLHTFPRAAGGSPAVRFSSEKDIVVWDGCVLQRFVNFTKSIVGSTLGGQHCGAIVDPTREGRYWLILENPQHSRVGTIPVLLSPTATLLDTQAWTSRPFALLDSQSHGFVAAQFDPRAQRACVVDDRLSLSCLRLADQTVQTFPTSSVVPLTLQFDDTGDQLVYATGPGLHEQKTFHLHSFSTGDSQLILTTASPLLRFLPGGTRLVEVGGLPSRGVRGAVVYDLQARCRQSLFPTKETGDGIAPVPGAAGVFVIGIERGPTRDLFVVRLPP